MRKFVFNEQLIFLLVFGFVTLILLAMTGSNLGTAARQKWMALPALIMIVFTTSQELKSRFNNYRAKIRHPNIRSR
jgi:hypothetical protein